MSGKHAALSALAILCAWDIMRPHQRSWAGKNPHRRHHRVYRLRINGKFHTFPNYHSLVRYQMQEAEAFLRWAEEQNPDAMRALRELQQQYEASAVYAPNTPSDLPLGTETSSAGRSLYDRQHDPAPEETGDCSTKKENV